jgi:hypothetical protein
MVRDILYFAPQLAAQPANTPNNTFDPAIFTVLKKIFKYLLHRKIRM